MSDHIFSVYKSCFLSILGLRRIRNTIDSTTAQTIATSLIHSKVDFSTSRYLNLHRSQLDHLQLILNSAARVDSPIFHLFSNLYIASNVSTDPLHNYLNHLQNTPIFASPPIPTIFSKSNLTRVQRRHRLLLWGAVVWWLAFGSIDRGIESEHRLFLRHNASCRLQQAKITGVVLTGHDSVRCL